jgi:type I restriction enzyme, S subunit
VLKGIVAGKSIKTLDRQPVGDELGILKVSAVTWGEFRPNESKAMPSGYEPGNCPRPMNGDVLISRANTRELVGAPVIVHGDHPRLLLSDKLLKLIPDERLVDRRFLVRALRSSAAAAHFSQRAGGSSGSMTNITQSDIRDAPMPLPELTEQRRIAAILDQADALRAQRRAALATLDELGRAVFTHLFGDVVANSKRWPAAIELGQVADVVSGVTKGRKLAGKSTRIVPYLAVANVQDMSLALANVKRIEATDEEIARYRLRWGDLLLTEGGDPDKLGRGCLWRDELPECIHQNHIFRVRVSDDRVLPLFLNWLLGSERGKRYFFRAAKQTTGIASINMTQLRGFPLLLPPVAIQRTFEDQLATIESLRIAHGASLAHLDALFASLQHRAFRGEL